MTGVLFYSFSFVLVVAALGVVLSRNPVYSAMLLVLSFFTSAVLWVLLEAEFLGIALVLVYVGAVMVLFLFVVMMLDINVETMREGMTRYTPLGIVVGLAVLGEIVFVVWNQRFGGTTFPTPAPKPADYSNTEALGAVMYTDYVLAFELAAVILLVAIVAAIMLTMRKRPGLKQQDINAQVSVNAKDRVRIVKMEAESKS
ncbi:MAG: NADH-quinone oxidoreductase subunit J [Gammaproteobacteria bacterium]